MATKCVLCGKEIVDFYDQNNPWPLATGEDDVCCPACNEQVITARILNNPERVMEEFGVDDEEASQMILNMFNNLRAKCKARK